MNANMTTNTDPETRLRSPEGKPGDREKLQSLLSRAQSQMPTPRERAVQNFHAVINTALGAHPESRISNPAPYSNLNTSRP